MKLLLTLLTLAGLLLGVPTRADDTPLAAATRVPTATEALAAFAAFRADPLARLDRTRPFLDFIRDSGEVHIVLNNDLLAWMYDPIDATLKAVLYAAFLGGNMAAQLAHQDSLGSGDDVAGMASALDAYAMVRMAHPEFSLPLFESLASARATQQLDAAVQRITSGTVAEP